MTQICILKKNIFLLLGQTPIIMTKNCTIILFIAGILNVNALFAQSKNLVEKNYQQSELPPHTLHQFQNAVRSQYFQIDFSQLDEQSVFTIPLFDGQSMSFKFKSAHHYKVGSSSWYGESIDGMGDVIFSFFQGNIKGTVKDNQMKKYMLQQINKTDLFAITEVNVESMQETQGNEPDYVTLPPNPHKKTRANADVCAPGTSCGGASVIDLMVLGNADAITDAGGTVPAFITDVTTAVTEMNTAYTTSGGTLLTFDLVHCDSYAFIPTANPSTDLSTFRSTPAVTLLRDTYFADLVGLWVGSGTYAGACGIGYVNVDETDYSDLAAYTVTDFDCGMTNLTYAHECGHNMGLRHDYYVDGSTTPCDHHHGYVNQTVIPGGMPVAGRWRTIMAYNNECSANGFGCTRLARWSNPSLTYLGDVMGRSIGMLEPSDEIYGFDRFRCVVSEFRSAGIPLPLPIVSIKGETNGDQITLSWKTSSEKNIKGFDIEMRRSFNEDFAKAAFVQAKGNSTVTSDYSHIIENATIGTYYFRLKQSDIDNKFMYSDVLKVEVTGDGFQTLIYPNPAKDAFTISYYKPENQHVGIAIYDITGKEVQKVSDANTDKGLHQMQVNTQGLQKGIYFCHAVCGFEKIVTKLIVE
jgi:hypothetical protein